MEKDDFRRLTDPRTVAVVGASNNVGSYGWRILNILRSFGKGTTRTIFVVNPAHAGKDIQGFTAYGSLLDLPEAPDCTLVIVPPPAVPQTLADMRAIGGRAGIVLTAPHGADPEVARKFDAGVAAAAAEHDLVLIGPNSMGLISAATGFAGTFGSGMLSTAEDEDPAPAGRVAMISQSGAAISYLIEEHRGRNVGYSHLISTGNETVVGFNDLLDQLVEDAQTDAIVLFIEALSEGRRTRVSLEKARGLGKTVVAMKIGNSDAGRIAAQSHSGRLAGGRAPYDALANDTGVVLVDGYQELFDAIRGLSAIPKQLRTRPCRRRAAIITSSGGAAVVGIDELGARGWTVPSLSAEVRADLDAALGRVGHDNPFDLLDLWRDDWRLSTTLKILAASGELDAVIVALGGGGPNAAKVVQLAADTARDLDMVVMFAGIGLRSEAQAALDRSGAPFFPDLRRAVTVLASLLTGPQPVEDPPNAAHVPAPAEGPATEPVPAGEVLRQLQAAGVTCAPSQMVPLDAAPDTLVAAATQLGFPVALKLEHRNLLHKSDVGGVMIDLRNPSELLAAQGEMAKVASKAGLDTPGLLVQKMIRGIEVLVGVQRDPSFGHMLVIGLGGTLTELLGDVRLTFLPTNSARIAALIAGHERLAALLAGHRGGAAASIESLITQIEGIAAWAQAQGDTLIEFDANPLTVTASGAYVIDARAVCLADGGR